MNILRAILVGLASFIFIVAVSGYVYLLTLQTTVMDRTVVKNWLAESSLYDGRIISALVQTTNAGGGQNGAPKPATDTLSASPEAIKSALNAAFTPEFTKTHIEGVVDNAYSWIEGTSPSFTFSIPIDQKRDVIITQLAKEIEPQVASLPVCQTIHLVQGATCRPADVSVAQLANELTTQSIDESGAFAAPLTNESFTKAQQGTSQQPEPNTAAQLPAIREGINTLLVVLPIAAVLSLATIILATAQGKRIARTARLSRRIFFGMLLIFIPAVVIIWFAKDTDFGLSTLFAAQTGELLVPLLKTVLVGTLGQLALITGIAGLISMIAWIALSVWKRHIPVTAPVSIPSPQPSQPQVNSTQQIAQQPSSDTEPDTRSF